MFPDRQLNIVAGPGAGQNLFNYDPFIEGYNPFVLNSVDPNRLLLGTKNLYESFDQGDTLTNLNFNDGSWVGGAPGLANNIGVPLVYGGHLGAVAPDVIWAGVGNQVVYREHRSDPLQVELLGTGHQLRRGVSLLAAMLLSTGQLLATPVALLTSDRVSDIVPRRSVFPGPW